MVPAHGIWKIPVFDLARGVRPFCHARKVVLLVGADKEALGRGFRLATPAIRPRPCVVKRRDSAASQAEPPAQSSERFRPWSFHRPDHEG
jgi:hypothetical protein